MDKPTFIHRDGIIADKAYLEWLSDIKKRFHRNQAKAAVQVNTAMLEFYWSLGKDLVEKRPEQVWGTGVIKQLSLDLRAAFKGIKGLSTVNLYFMRRWFAFYQEAIQAQPQLFYQAGKIPQMPELFALIPWRHHTNIISKCKSVEEALFYIHKTVDNNWSRSVLDNNIDADLYKTQGCAIANFSSKLPVPQSSLAQNLLKDSIGNRKTNDLSVELIIKTVADYFNISHVDIKGKKRNTNISFARQISMYLIREMTNYSTTEIGIEFGGKDHSTVMYSCRQIEEKLKCDPTMDSTIQTLKTRIKNQSSAR